MTQKELKEMVASLPEQNDGCIVLVCDSIGDYVDLSDIVTSVPMLKKADGTYEEANCREGNIYELTLIIQAETDNI